MLPRLSKAARARHSARAASVLKACALQAAAKVANAAAPSKQSGLKRQPCRAAQPPPRTRVTFGSSLHIQGPGGVVVRAHLSRDDVSGQPSSSASDDSRKTRFSDAGQSRLCVSGTGGASDAGGRLREKDVKHVEHVPLFVGPAVKDGAARVAECAASICDLSMQNPKRFQCPTLVRRTTTIEPLIPRDAGVYGIIQEKQQDCAFLLAAADAEVAKSTLATVALHMKGWSRDHVCVRVRWSGKAKEQALDFTLTQRIVADMVGIHAAKAVVMQVLNAQAWLKAKRSLRQCPGGARGRTRQCIRCDAGSAESPLCEGRSLERLVDDICSGLPLVTVKGLVFQYWGKSRRAERYKELSLDLNDVFEVLSNQWMTGAFHGAATVMPQEEAEAKGLPVHVLMCEESASSIGCHARPRNTAAAYQQCTRLAKRISKAQMVLFLVNVDNCHWMSSEVDVVKKTVTVFDSLKTSGKELERTISRIVMLAHTLYLDDHVPNDVAQHKRFSMLLSKVPRDAERTAEARFKNEACKELAVRMVHDPQQPDSDNCGAFACMHLRHGLLGLPVKMTGGSGEVFRVKMGWDLMMDGRRYSKCRSGSATEKER